MTPLLVHGQSEPRAAATPSRAEEGSRREAEAPDGQGNTKTRNTGEQKGELGVGECSNFKKIRTHTQDHGDA